MEEKIVTTVPEDRPAMTTSHDDGEQYEVSRRDFVKVSALLGGSAILASQGEEVWRAVMRTPPPRERGMTDRPTVPYDLARAENQIYTVCLQCNTGCGIKAKIQNGVITKIDGNPYNPWAFYPHVPYTTSPFDMATVDGYICPKGQAGIQTAYDPYRITKVLKRAGKRGEGKWMTIPFEQAVSEIVEGGKLFSHVPGEENRVVPGLKEIWALRDPAVQSAMGADAKLVATKKMPLDEFKKKWGAYLDTLIDPDHPDLGPKNNQLVFAWGRLKAGRSDLISRFTVNAFGSVNAHGHTTVCQGSLYFTGKAMSEQFTDGKWTGGKKFYWQCDTANAEFIIFVGASPFEGNYGPPLRVHKITDGLVSGRLKYVVVDPRFSKTAAKAWKWVPIKPGTEGAMALALIQWIIANKRYNAAYLENANKAAAAAKGELNWCNATWLVRIDEKGQPGKFVRASELGLPGKETRKDASGKDYEFDPFVVLRDGKPIAFDPYDTKTPVVGDLLVNTEINGVKVKSALQLLWESASANTLDGWAQVCDVKAKDLVAIAEEFTSHGRKAAADIHRGVSQHTNGFYNVFAWYSLNLLIGNYDAKGGMVQVATYDINGTKPGQPYQIGNMPNKAAPFGISIIRHDVKYEDTTLFDGKYPAKRPFYPLSSDIYQEIIPSIGDAYPYPVKALIFYMGSPVYSLPAGHTNIEVLADVNKLPLFIANDIVIGETSMYADYIFPDLSYLERWEFQGSHPSVPFKVQPVRQPAIAPLTETVTVFGQQMPLSLEAMLLGMAEKLGLPGFGPDGFGKGIPLVRPEDLYIRQVANLAAGEKADGSDAVPDATDKEMELFLNSRKHLPKTVFDPAYWQKVAGDKWWRKVVYVLNRGGRFQDFDKGYKGDWIANPYGTLINMYQEKTATTKNSMTGKLLSGIATYIPAPADVTGNPITDEKDGYDLHLITFREMAHTKSRTIADYWLLALLPENSIIMNKVDADRRGLKDGDLVRVVSPTNPEGAWDLKNGRKLPLVGRVRVIQGIRPGVIAFSLGHGHWAYGSSDVVIDGQTVKADPRRAKGVHLNAATRVDPVLKNTTLVDVYGGSAVFYDSLVKVVKV